MLPSQKRNYKYGSNSGKNNTLLVGGAAILLLVLFAIAAIAFFMFIKPSAPEEPKDIGIPNVKPPEEDCSSDECLAKLAKEQNNPTLCDLILSSDKKQVCLEGLALTSFEACQKIIDYDKRKECGFEHAKIQKAIWPCQKLELNEQDERACILLTDKCYFDEPGEQELCEAIDKNNVTYCTGNEECIIAYAKSTKNEASCSEISDLPKQYACISLLKESPICHNLEVKAKEDYCYELYSKMINQSTYCSSITDGSDYEWRCHAYFAIGQKNLTQCKTVDLLARWSCYRNYSAETGDIEGCRAIHELALTSKYGCLFDLATIHGNMAACEDFQYANDKGRCYSAAIYQHKKPIAIEYCSVVQDEHWRDSCYSTVAAESKDASICTKYIQGEGERQLCQQRVEKAINAT